VPPKVDVVAAACTCGALWGGSVFLLTLFAALQGHGEHLKLLANYYPGYSITPLGALVGLLWAALDGIIFGWLGALVYNRLLSWRHRS
jgi:hypothetical protein